ncbi:MAG: phosphatidylserine decarboxylase family protein [Burkholderiales bacterium]|nr:phosphatidylserine decarboxylase family protein [Phycisphaerae bacterium]
MLRFTRHGLWEMVYGTIALALIGSGLFLIHPLLALAPFVIWLWLMAFFRDPHRAIPAGDQNWVSPADGMVSDIKEIEHDDLLAGPAVRVGIFLNVFSVHVNRSPCDGVVIQTIYKEGKFINAMKHGSASSDNESNTILLGDASGKPIAVVKQIVGLIARRIVCTSTQGVKLARGDHMGMIKFGSRTELLIPKWLNPQIKVQVGQKVRGAADVIAVVTPV